MTPIDLQAASAVFALLLIFGRAGFPELGIAGAGWATVVGSWTSALLALAPSSAPFTESSSPPPRVGGGSATCSSG